MENSQPSSDANDAIGDSVPVQLRQGRNTYCVFARYFSHTRGQNYTAALLAKISECNPGVKAPYMDLNLGIPDLLLHAYGVIAGKFVGVA
jgi:hypothetical protein